MTQSARRSRTVRFPEESLSTDATATRDALNRAARLAGEFQDILGYQTKLSAEGLSASTTALKRPDRDVTDQHGWHLTSQAFNRHGPRDDRRCRYFNAEGAALKRG